MAKTHRILELIFLLWGAFSFAYAGYILYLQHLALSIICAIVSLGVLWLFIRQLRHPAMLHSTKKLSWVTICVYLLLAGLFVCVLINGRFNTIGLLFAIAVLLHMATNVVGTNVKS